MMPDIDIVEIEGFDARGFIVGTASKGMDGRWRYRCVSTKCWAVVPDEDYARMMLARAGAVHFVNKTHADMMAQLVVN